MRQRIAICIGIVLALFSSCMDSQPVSERETAVELLARHIGGELKPRAVLVLSNPFTRMSGRPAETYAFEEASLRGLSRGFGKETAVKQAFPELRPEALQDAASVQVDPRSTTPLSFLVEENAFQKAVDQNPDCTVVISLIGLPADMKSFPAWQKAGDPMFGLLLPDWRMIGGPKEILQAFEAGKLIAAIVQGPAGSDGKQFVLVTRGNIAEMLASKPGLFGL